MDFYNYPGSDQSSSESPLTFLQGLTDKDWSELVSYSQTLQFKKDDYILKAGDESDGVYILVTGRVEVIAKNTFGIRKSIAEIDEGSVFGELSFFDQQVRGASIRAMSDGKALRLSHSGFELMAANNPALARHFLIDLGRILTYRFRQLSTISV